MLVEINPNKKLKNGDTLVYQNGKFEPVNITDFLKGTKDNLEKYENQIKIFENQVNVSNDQINVFDEKLNIVMKDLTEIKSFFVEILKTLGGGVNV